MIDAYHVTSCKDCIFAEYQNDTQIECKIGQLEKFKLSGSEVIAAKDDTKEFYIIKNRVCALKRSKRWAEKQKGDLEQVARKEIQPQIDILIYIDEYNFIYIDKTLKNIPKNILILRAIINSEKVKTVSVRDKLSKFTIPWLVHKIVEPEASRGRSIDIALKESACHFYAVFNSGSEIPSCLIDTINVGINDKLMRFLAVKPTEVFDGTIISLKCHKYLNGNVEVPILQKITEASEQENTPHLITTFEELQK